MMKLRYVLLFGLLVILSISYGYALAFQQHTVPETIQVTMYVLNPDDGDIAENTPVCTKGSVDYGCGYKDPKDSTKNRPYEYDSHIITVNFEDEYLPTVLAKELGGTSVKQYEALKAQAIACLLTKLQTPLLNITPFS